MSKFEVLQAAVDTETAGHLTESGSDREPDRRDAAPVGELWPLYPGGELVPGVDVSDMTVPEFLAVARPVTQWLPASTFAHISGPNELALELNCAAHLINRRCPEIQRLIASTEGSLQGAFLAKRLAPSTAVGKPKPIRRKRWPKGKRAEPESLFKIFPSAN